MLNAPRKEKTSRPFHCSRTSSGSRGFRGEVECGLPFERNLRAPLRRSPPGDISEPPGARGSRLQRSQRSTQAEESPDRSIETEKHVLRPEIDAALKREAGQWIIRKDRVIGQGKADQAGGEPDLYEKQVGNDNRLDQGRDARRPASKSQLPSARQGSGPCRPVRRRRGRDPLSRRCSR